MNLCPLSGVWVKEEADLSIEAELPGPVYAAAGSTPAAHPALQAQGILACGMFHFDHLLVEGVHHVSQHFCLLCPVVNGIHFPPKGVKKADLSEAAITVQNPPVIHVNLNITPLLSGSGLGIDSYVVAEGVSIGRRPEPGCQQRQQ